MFRYKTWSLIRFSIIKIHFILIVFLTIMIKVSFSNITKMIYNFNTL